MTVYIRTIISFLLTSLVLSACGGGSSDGDTASAIRRPTPSPSPEPEAFSLEIEPTATNDPIGDFHTNLLNITGRVTGDEPIGFVAVTILDDLDIFDDDIQAQQSLNANFLSIRLSPKEPLRRGEYDGALALTFCSSPSCTTVLGESPYFVNYTINYIPENWSFDFQDHPNVTVESNNRISDHWTTVNAVSAEGEVPAPIEVLVDWPQDYIGFTLPQDMIDALQVFDIREDGFSFRLTNSTLGNYEYEYAIALDSDSTPSTSTFTVRHAVVPDEFDGSRAQLLTNQLDFYVANKFDDDLPAQSARVYRPLGGDIFDSIEFSGISCRWLTIDDGIGISEAGFTDVAVKITTFWLEQGSQTCESDVRYKGESIGTLTVNVVSEN